MTDAKPSRPIDEKSILAQATKDNMEAAGVKKEPPTQTKVNPATRMKEPRQVTRSIRTGNIIETY